MRARPKGWGTMDHPIHPITCETPEPAEHGFTVTSRRKCPVECHRALLSTRDYQQLLLGLCMDSRLIQSDS